MAAKKCRRKYNGQLSLELHNVGRYFNPYLEPQKMNPVKYELFYGDKTKYWFVTRTLNKEAAFDVLMELVDVKINSAGKKMSWSVYVTENGMRYQFATNNAKNKVKPFIVWHLRREKSTSL